MDFIDDAAALNDLEELYGLAYDLAMIIRESKTVFEWGQQEDPEAIVDADYVVHPSHGHPHRRGAFVVFGPLYTLTDQGSQLIRKGELLIPSSVDDASNSEQDLEGSTEGSCSNCTSGN